MLFLPVSAPPAPVASATQAGSGGAGLGSAALDSAALDRAMDRYAQGQDAAFSEVFAGLFGRLHAFVRRMGASAELADDVAQETLLKIHQARANFEAGRSVVPWAYAIARNCYIGHTRSLKHRAARSAVDSEQLELAAGLDSNAEEATIAKQSARTIEQALARMTQARREAFVLLRYEGLSVAAAAAVLGVTEGALKVRAFHAYQELRAALQAAEPGPLEAPAPVAPGRSA